MFVVSSTMYGINQRMLAFEQLVDAMARAGVGALSPMDRTQIYKVPGAESTGAAVHDVTVGRGVFIAGLSAPVTIIDSDPAKSQLVSLMYSEALQATEQSGSGLAAASKTP